ncbi:MAG: DNA recombination protein RmuC [Gemmatimonadales bacterium]|jgi:DNA recombination protein RmuC
MAIETLLLVGLALLVLLVVWLAWRQLRVERNFAGLADGPPASMQLLQREVQALRAGVDERLREQLRQADELSHRIGQLQKATEHVEHLGTGLEELQKILQPPQLRGAFGERLLEEALAEMLPADRYCVQYTYPSSGVRVDVAILLGEGRLLPIDSKFPLENFRRYLGKRQQGDPEAEASLRAFARDVRSHVDDVASKYLSPDDGALDVAFMYIPSESVFHEVVVGGLDIGGTALSEYALRRRVVPVSPNTLNAYLAVVRMGLRGYKLQESTREILSSLTHLQSDLVALRSEFGTAIKQARHSLANLTEAETALTRIELRMDRLNATGQPGGRLNGDVSGARFEAGCEGRE